MNRRFLLLILTASALWATDKKKTKKPAAPAPVDIYVKDATRHAVENPGGIAGSLWTSGARFENLAADLRAGRVDDIITVVVNEQASALASGNVKTSRNSGVSSAITAAGGPTRPSGPWANLAKSNTQIALDGQGTTSRQATLSTTLTARVTQVLPNGYLVIEGDKNLQVNSENQAILLRGVVRPVDLDATNAIESTRIGQLEVKVNGKGVVGDAIRRPFFLYRLLLGLLPF